MADLLLLIGICLVFWSIWHYRRKNTNEVEDLGQLQQELLQAKEDVNLLMKELAGVSEQVVDSISQKIKAAQDTIEKLDNSSLEKNPVEAEEPIQMNPAKENKVINFLGTRNKDKEPKKENVTREPAPREIKKKQFREHQELLLENCANSTSSPSAKHQAVYSLAEMGYSVEEIAKKLAIGKGEADLILQLKFKGEKANEI